MANKAIPGWTQVPVVVTDLASIHYDRLNLAATSNQITVVYEVRDTLGAVRQTATLSQQVTSYPISLAVILSTINAAQGT